jgi:cold shock CspA family protein
MTGNRAIKPEKFKGTIKSIKKAEGYGFITHTATGEDHFFHRSAVLSPHTMDELHLDQSVLFTPFDSPKGLRAAEVEPA